MRKIKLMRHSVAARFKIANVILVTSIFLVMVSIIYISMPFVALTDQTDATFLDIINVK
jgi:hypothetical protein